MTTPIPTEPPIEIEPHLEGWYWHAFHEEVLSYLSYPAEEREAEIAEWKPKWEKARRLRLFQEAELPDDIQIKIDEEGRTEVAYLATIPGLEALHEEQCERRQPQGCPWTDSTRTIFPELAKIGISVGGSREEYYDDPEGLSRYRNYHGEELI